MRLPHSNGHLVAFVGRHHATRQALITATAFLLLAILGHSQTCSQADVQAAVNAATDGQTVSVPAGNCTWSSPVTWTDKNIAVIGAGIGVTNITASGQAFNIVNGSKASWRISGMTFVYADSTKYLILITNNGNTSVSGWRIDHIRVNQTGSAGTGNAFQIIGMTWGLIDHLTYDNNNNAVEAINNYAYSNSFDSPSNIGGIAWTKALDPGGPTAVYVEDSTFNFNGGNPQVAVNDIQYGGRMVIRHNVIHGGLTMSHAAWDSVRGAQKMEIYNNTIDATGGTRPFLLRSGFNLVFSNTVTGTWNLGNTIYIDNVRDTPGTGNSCNVGHTQCSGSQIYDNNSAGGKGYLCEDQIGTGAGDLQHQNAQPSYFWNNNIPVVINGACDPTQVSGGIVHVVAGRDYFDNGTAMPSYTPYTYPHPLQGAVTSPPPPVPPTQLSAIAH